ncbi:618_t:CDS:2, partial [Diversispora eburnea]
MSMEIGKQSQQIKVWRHVGERYDVECLAPSFKSGQHPETKKFSKSVDELKTALSEEWSKFDVSILRKVVNSIPQRIEEVLDTKRGQQ